ncbi:hypothetical protein BO443_40461 [Burkholderia orbicola]
MQRHRKRPIADNMKPASRNSVRQARRRQHNLQVSLACHYGKTYLTIFAKCDIDDYLFCDSEIDIMCSK